MSDKHDVVMGVDEFFTPVVPVGDIREFHGTTHLEPKRQQEVAQIRQEIEVSKQVVQGLVELARASFNPMETYVSYDAMPVPLQRVIKAYAAREEANRELAEAIKAL